MLLGVVPTIDTKKTCVLGEIGLHAQTTMTFMGSIVNIMLGGPIRPFNEHKTLHFEFIHLGSKNYEESDYGLDLDVLTISYKSCVSGHKRSGLVRKKRVRRRRRNHLRLICNRHF